MQLEFSNEKYDIALKSAKAFIWEADISQNTIRLSPSFEHVLGYKVDEIENDLEKFINYTILPEEIKRIRKSLDFYTKSASENIFFETAAKNSYGDDVWLRASGGCLSEDKKMIYGICFDVSELKMHEKLLSELAYKDSLTGLYNMQYLTDGYYKPFDPDVKKIGFIVIDIRGFRNINEAFGHEFGDITLICFTEKIKQLSGENLIIRISGDEFLIVFENNVSTESMMAKAQSILGIFDEPFIIRKQLIQLNLKIGVAVSKEIENRKIDIVSLFKDAEIALYYAKRNEFDNICLLNDHLKNELDKKVNMEFELKNAAIQKEFILYFQPKIDAKSKKVVGAEALIRWKHPQHGIVPPMSFIPLAEESGLIINIGEYVIAETARQLSLWHKKGYNIFISLNVSAKQFLSPDFVDCIYRWMRRYSLPPKSIMIEITESVFISDFEHISDILHLLRASGVKVSLDDFGTGYSSLSYLGKMPLDNLKIDRTFLVNALNNKNDLSILKAIIVLAHNMNLFVTAEGVESTEHLKILEEYGCDVYQGFLFSKPLPPDEFEMFIRENKEGFVV